MTKVNISNVKRVLIATVEQREHQGNTMENPQLSTIRNRLHKIIWFDSLFNQNVKTKIEKKLLKLLKQHYPKHLKLIRIQKNTVKLSYCYMNSIIKQHNVKILSAECNEK